MYVKRLFVEEGYTIIYMYPPMFWDVLFVPAKDKGRVVQDAVHR